MGAGATRARLACMRSNQVDGLLPDPIGVACLLCARLGGVCPAGCGRWGAGAAPAHSDVPVHRVTQLTPIQPAVHVAGLRDRQPHINYHTCYHLEVICLGSR